ncbi:hypothetical protein [Rothia mucilaginosa]|uniref:hypothetical protein n=1 Tax=Rothia mucilaginosa TaxID=43675 RepID=UPI0028DCF687|nr:hypothetical protein [Rothia mucilaginosa]
MIHDIPLDPNTVASIHDIANWINSHKKITIAILLLIPIITLSVYVIKNYKQRKYNTLSTEEYRKKRDGFTLAISTICVLTAFSVPLWLNLSLSKNEPGSIILQSLLTVSGGLVILLTFMENRRKNDIDESKNIDDSTQKLHSSRHDRNTKSIELMFSENIPAAISAVYSLCGIADEWANDYIKDKKDGTQKEVQSIINTLCSYIRECGAEPRTTEVCKTILNEINNRISIPENGYSDWSAYIINLENSTFKSPFVFNNIKSTDNIKIDGAIFESIFKIAANPYSDLSKSEPILLKNCTFKDLVSLDGIKISNDTFKFVQFVDNAHLRIKNNPVENPVEESSKNDKKPDLLIEGTYPTKIELSNAQIRSVTIDGDRSNQNTPYAKIPGGIHIKECKNTSIKIPRTRVILGGITVKNIEYPIGDIYISNCWTTDSIILDAPKINSIEIKQSVIRFGLNVNSNSIKNIDIDATEFHREGNNKIVKFNNQSLPHYISFKSTKSQAVFNVSGDIKNLSIHDTRFYVPLTISSFNIERLIFNIITFYMQLPKFDCNSIKTNPYCRNCYFESHINNVPRSPISLIKNSQDIYVFKK